MGAAKRHTPAADEASIGTGTRRCPGADAGQHPCAASDPILALRGTGREIWADEDADAYVRRLREGWR